jgi:hypothetical protein
VEPGLNRHMHFLEICPVPGYKTNILRLTTNIKLHLKIDTGLCKTGIIKLAEYN